MSATVRAFEKFTIPFAHLFPGNKPVREKIVKIKKIQSDQDGIVQKNVTMCNLL